VEADTLARQANGRCSLARGLLALAPQKAPFPILSIGNGVFCGGGNDSLGIGRKPTRPMADQ